jgi:ribose-phosphate pyrophosphokinase
MIAHAAETALVLALPGAEGLSARLAGALQCGRRLVEARHFPDGEWYLRIGGEVHDQPVVITATLDRPDEKLLPLLLLTGTAREQGAAEVGLVAPYLPYLRQDRRFRPGEAVSAVHFAGVISGAVDWVVTVEPHLHRLHNLAEVYQVPACAVTVAPCVAAWVREQVPQPFLVGPDEESHQWAGPVAAAADVPFTVVRKCRVGDFHVEIALPDLSPFKGRTPVVIDDIISTGRTMEQIVRKLVQAGYRTPQCVAVHGIFAADAYARIRQAGAAGITTCNTVPHPTNGIDVTPPIVAAVRSMLDRSAEGWKESAI